MSFYIEFLYMAIQIVNIFDEIHVIMIIPVIKYNIRQEADITCAQVSSKYDPLNISMHSCYDALWPNNTSHEKCGMK